MQSWQQVAFAAAMAERLFPHFALYSNLLGQDGETTLKGVLDNVWNQLVERGKCNIVSQINRVENVMPSDDDESLGADMAVDALVAVLKTLSCLQNDSAEDAVQVAQLAYECVAQYIERTADRELDDDQLVRHIATHELMEGELNFQTYALIHLGKMPTPSLPKFEQLRIQACNDGISNIGISAQIRQ